MLKFNVVITSYNYGLYIRESLASVLSQTYDNFEVIIVDDGSQDGTKEIVSTYSSDTRIKYFYQDNAGQPKAKNRGICESRGEFIAFLDADDIWMPSKLEKQLALFADPEVGVVYSRRQWIDPNGVEISGNERMLQRGMILDQIFVDNFVCFSSSVIRRSYLEQVGYFDESLPMGIDYDLWIRLASVCKFDFVDEPLVKYRTGHSNLSKNTMKRYECAQQILRKNLSNPQVRALMTWYVPALAWADTWSNFGYYLATIGKKREGFFYALRAICKFPFYINAYKRFIKLMLVR
jgi:glycosyltransferase involved in cell wall biosynthesis